MKIPKQEFYVKVKDHRYKNHPSENNVLQKPDPLKSVRTQNQVQNDTQISKNQKAIENNNNELEV